MYVLHANWVNGSIKLWSESLRAYNAHRRFEGHDQKVERQESLVGSHTFAAEPAELRAKLALASLVDQSTLDKSSETATIRLRLPSSDGIPCPSDRLAAFLAIDRDSFLANQTTNGEDESKEVELSNIAAHDNDVSLAEFTVNCLVIPNDVAVEFLLGLRNAKPGGTTAGTSPGMDGALSTPHAACLLADSQEPTAIPELGEAIEYSHSLRYWMEVAQFVAELLIDQRFIPTLIQSRAEHLEAAWLPWLHDDDARRRLGLLVRAMPPAVRASIDRHDGAPWRILLDAVSCLADATIRGILGSDEFIGAIQGRDPATDLHVAWLQGLLDRNNRVGGTVDLRAALLHDASVWMSRLYDDLQRRPLRLCLRLNEPSGTSATNGSDTSQTTHGWPAEDFAWPLSFHLQSPDDPQTILDAQRIWNPSAQGQATLSDPSKAGPQIENPQDLLLSELGRASRIYPKIESVLSQPAPTGVMLTTAEAYAFLHHVRPVLEESNICVLAPAWWEQPTSRLSAQLHIDAPPSKINAAQGASPTRTMLGLNSLVRYRWQVAIGDEPLTPEEFHALAQQTAPLIRIRGKWIEINPEQFKTAREFLEQSREGEMTLLQAIRITNGMDGNSGESKGGLPVYGLDATGWVAELFGASSQVQRVDPVPQPAGFNGTLRQYQLSGLSWLSFLDRLGLGACLADDMGLGKTIQLIALLLHEREQAASVSAVAPTLLVAPTSVVTNWVREVNRFAPSLKVYLHHGPDRALGETGEQFVEAVRGKDLVMTTYALLSRDLDALRRVQWHRVALDEAQYIKNPPTKQASAIRALAGLEARRLEGSTTSPHHPATPRRVALTGTPVENRLGELWSILDFCNPGYLGSAGEFRRRFALPIERRRDQRQAQRLRQMVRPFILRRVKSDPNVLDDLPLCLQTREYATLSPEQAAMYQRVVDDMLAHVDQAQGMQRRGLVLTGLLRLKQICNHPELIQKTQAADQRTDGSMTDGLAAALELPLSARSGKCRRLMTMLEEVIASGEKALLFTQFRHMGHLLTSMIQGDLDVEALFLHGGTPASKRQHLIDRFQSPQGGVPIFVLSLKAGGLGLNLTAANHVFHVDRWWNPAVENQATDRAFRIGQTRNVHVHKFVCIGTLEERIDQMIEQKTELAQNIIGAGEQWLTELSNRELRDLLMLRPSALETES
jgi:SNF2 family DNA or RNA helicase